MRCIHLGAVAALMLGTLGGLALADEQGKNFVLSVDGKEVGIDIGDTLEVDTADGQKIKLSLKRAAEVTHRGDMLSFSHRGELGVSNTDIDKDIRQHLLATANGTIIIVQEYAGLDPTSLLELMLTSVTEESVAAGGKMTKAESKREAGGREIKGLKAELVNGSDKTHVEVYTLGTAGKGLVIITQIADDYLDIDQAVLDLFWKSVKLKL